MAVLRIHTHNGKEITLKARRESTVIVQGRERSYTFDYGGRLVSAVRGGSSYRRSFTNEILERRSEVRSGEGSVVRRTLSPEEVRALEVEAYDLAGTAAVALRETPQHCEPETLEAVRHALEHVNAYCYTGLEREKTSFAQIYQPVTVLPPDQALALYLQMTEGCLYSECTFCNFLAQARPGSARRYRIKPPEVFREHIRRVRAFLGEGLRMRKTIFLGDANALLMPQKMLLARFEIVNEELDLLPLDLTPEERHAWREAHPVHFNGIYSFVDSLSAEPKSAQEFAELAGLGLRRVYVGLLSGDTELLKTLGKRGTPDAIAQLVRQSKAGGVAVGIIVPIGVGGEAFERAHVEHTAQLIESLPLDERDTIYLSEPASFPGAGEGQPETGRWGAPLTRAQMDDQMEVLRETLTYASRARVNCYDVREFVY